LDITNYTPHLEGFDLRLASRHKETTTAQNAGTNFLKNGVHMCVWNWSTWIYRIVELC